MSHLVDNTIKQLYWPFLGKNANSFIAIGIGCISYFFMLYILDFGIFFVIESPQKYKYWSRIESQNVTLKVCLLKCRVRSGWRREYLSVAKATL